MNKRRKLVIALGADAHKAPFGSFTQTAGQSAARINIHFLDEPHFVIGDVNIPVPSGDSLRRRSDYINHEVR
jgi:hypothetical protein